jgi:hypothetical protein
MQGRDCWRHNRDGNRTRGRRHKRDQHSFSYVQLAQNGIRALPGSPNKISAVTQNNWMSRPFSESGPEIACVITKKED